MYINAQFVCEVLTGKCVNTLKKAKKLYIFDILQKVRVLCRYMVQIYTIRDASTFQFYGKIHVLSNVRDKNHGTHF